MARPRGKLRGTSARRTPSPRSTRAITAAGVAFRPSFSSPFTTADQASTVSTVACARARSRSRSLTATTRRRPTCTKRNGSGAKKAVGYRMSASDSDGA